MVCLFIDSNVAALFIIPFCPSIFCVFLFSQETKVESNSKPRGWEEPDDHVISSGLDSEMTDAMEIDEKLPNLSGNSFFFNSSFNNFIVHSACSKNFNIHEIYNIFRYINS